MNGEPYTYECPPIVDVETWQRADAAAAAYADATRLRSHELGQRLDGPLSTWVREAREELSKQGQVVAIVITFCAVNGG